MSIFLKYNLHIRNRGVMGKWNENKWFDLSSKLKQTHRHRGQTSGCQGAVGRERDGLGTWG